MPVSETSARVTIRHPQEREITIRPFTRPLTFDPDNRLTMWYLELTDTIDIMIGASRSRLEEDLAAMTRLQAAAGEAIDLLTGAIIARRDEEAGRG